jgi:outer membrane immunogenic protein
MIKKLGALALAAAAVVWGGSAALANCHSGPFNGLYIGAGIGYAGVDADHFPEGQSKVSSDDGGFTAGVYGGYNLQCGRFVVGVEGDISWVDLDTRGTAADGTTFRTSVDWLGTLRGRVGVTVHDNVLLYATGGVAWADRGHRVFDPNAPGGAFSQSDSDTATGWVVGGGVEFLRHERWLFRAEVLYVGLEDQNKTYTVSTTGCGGGVCTSRVKWEDDMLVARVGLAIKLGGREATYEPLK